MKKEPRTATMNSRNRVCVSRVDLLYRLAARMPVGLATAGFRGGIHVFQPTRAAP